jgi:protein-L-isoaspartate(D-aspartate) O-methyltransferase
MPDPMRLMRFVLEMRQAGITDARALSALERAPRTHYAPGHLEGLALDDVALPLAHGQTMTKPSVVGRVVEALDVQANDVVLEVGTGSGFQAAAISTLAHKVITLERWRDLAADARGRFGTARLMKTYCHAADGADGWDDEAPFDRIVVNAAMADFPEALLEQLKPGGVLLAPLGDAQNQRLIRYRNGAREDLGPVKFQPLQRGVEAGEAPEDEQPK